MYICASEAQRAFGRMDCSPGVSPHFDAGCICRLTSRIARTIQDLLSTGPLDLILTITPTVIPPFISWGSRRASGVSYQIIESRQQGPWFLKCGSVILVGDMKHHHFVSADLYDI